MDSLVNSLDRIAAIGLAIGTVSILLYVVAGRIWSRKRGRMYWTGSSVGNALEELQATARPSIEYHIEEKLKERTEDDDQSGPDDPGSYYRRLRTRIDPQTLSGRETKKEEANPDVLAVDIRNVTKTFGPKTAVDQLSLSVPEAFICGLIGPNGSGKTTTMRMISRIVYPDSGTIRVFGQDRYTGIGYLPEERGVYRKMRVRALLRFHAELRGGHNFAGEIDSWLDRLEISQWADNKVETLSKGMSQKVQFIAAVVPEPRLLILDEPMTGLDPVSAESIRKAITEMRARGSTVILSTHDMALAEGLCDSIVMMYRGKKVLDGSVASVKSGYGRDALRVETEGGLTVLDDLPGVTAVRNLGTVQQLELADMSYSQRVIRELATRTTILSLSVVKPTLHDIFVAIARPNGSGEPA